MTTETKRWACYLYVPSWLDVDLHQSGTVGESPSRLLRFEGDHPDVILGLLAMRRALDNIIDAHKDAA